MNKRRHKRTLVFEGRQCAHVVLGICRRCRLGAEYNPRFDARTNSGQRVLMPTAR